MGLQYTEMYWHFSYLMLATPAEVFALLRGEGFFTPKSSTVHTCRGVRSAAWGELLHT